MKTPSKTKRVVYASLAGLGITAGGATLASAATSQAPASSTTIVSDAPGQPDTQDPTYQSSVTVPQTPDTAEGTDDESAESAALAGLAKISEQQASDAALAAVPGTVEKVHLGDENGNVVYEVEVLAADGTKVEVKVDAGNGSVLHQETDNESEGSENSD